MPPATTFNTMRSPQQPWPSFSLMMLQAYPALAPLLFPPANAEEGYNDDTRSWTTDGFEVESRLSQGDDDLMFTVDYGSGEPRWGPVVYYDESDDESVDAVRRVDETGVHDTLNQLKAALDTDVNGPPTQPLLRRRLSALIIELATKVISKFNRTRSSRASATTASSA